MCLHAAGHQLPGAAAAKSPAPPLFVTVPPRTQKVVHSETYLRCAFILLFHLCDVFTGWHKNGSAVSQKGAEYFTR